MKSTLKHEFIVFIIEMPGFFSEFIRRLNFKKPKLKFTPKTFLEFSTIFGIIYLFALTYEYDNLFSPVYFLKNIK